MDSFVDNFKDKRIAIETLERMVKVNYQRDALLELAIKNYQSKSFEISVFSKYILNLESTGNSIFILLSSNNSTLELIKEQTINNRKKLTIIVFDQTDKFNILENKIFINTTDWMNKIISHGINRQILDLQYLRDMAYHYA